MTGGEFLTFCHEGGDSIVFLCHVPSLRSYKSAEAKDGLNKIAWSAASAATSAMDPGHRKSLVVGLRGITTYGAVMKGTSSGSPDISDDEESLYSAFKP